MSEKMTVADVMAFARTNCMKIVLRGAVSLLFVVGFLALYYAFAPRKESWRQEMVVTLEHKGDATVYPNGRLFSSTDILSAPVLGRIWKEQGLMGKVKFEDFCKWFSVVSYDRDRAKIDAEYQTKMGKRNITVTELTTLQREYETKLAARLADNRYMLAMTPTALLSREASVAVLNAVPSAWFAEYSVLNAPQMPSVVQADVLTAYAKRLQVGEGWSPELIDALRLYVTEMSYTCKYIREALLCGRNVFVDGIDLGVYEARLNLAKAEIMRFKSRLLANGNPEDLGNFVAVRLDDVACEILAAEEKANAVMQTIELLSDSSGNRRGGGAKEPSSSEGAVTLQADATFFQDFASLVRRDTTQAAVQKYANELANFRKAIAEIKALKLYYDQIGNSMKKVGAGAGKDGSKLSADIVAFTAELVDLGNKVVAFRDRCLQIYRTPDQFYALPSPVFYAKGFVFSISRLALGLLALWALYNLICLVLAWNRRFPTA